LQSQFNGRVRAEGWREAVHGWAVGEGKVEEEEEEEEEGAVEPMYHV